MDSPDGNSRSTKYGVSSEKEYRWLRMSDLQLFLDHGKYIHCTTYIIFPTVYILGNFVLQEIQKNFLLFVMLKLR